MADNSNPDLKSRLIACAEIWCQAHGAPLTRLAKLVTSDARRLDRVADGNGLNVDTLEKFARYLIDPANWPEGVAVPEAVAAFGQVVGVCPHDPAISAPGVAASAGKIGENSSVGGAA